MHRTRTNNGDTSAIRFVGWVIANSLLVDDRNASKCIFTEGSAVRELIKRVSVASIIGPIVIILLWFGGYPLLVLTSLVGIGLIIEFFKLSKQKISLWRIILICLLAVIWQTAVFSGYENLLQLFLGSVIILLVTELSTKATEGTQERSSSMLFTYIYAGPITSTILLVRRFGAHWAILPVAMVWIVDTAAYWGGSLTGKHKLAPEFSPKKTVEGFLWGIVSAVIIAIVVPLIWSKFDTTKLWLCAMVTAFAGQLGDLFESKLKRQFGVKDSGKILPGHGGIWDRTDSILWVYPLVWIILTLIK
ncbi:hypothetical protein DRQ27_00295 [bacterium]|nr:MAG: hypothetical protein DRQ27_00295 [bacterium]